MPRQVLINSTKQDAINLGLIFGRPIISEELDEETILVPEWVELMYIHGKEDTE